MDADEGWRQRRAAELFGAVPLGGSIDAPASRAPDPPPPLRPSQPAAAEVPAPMAAPVPPASAAAGPRTPPWRIILAVALLLQGGVIVWLLLTRGRPQVVVIPAATATRPVAPAADAPPLAAAPATPAEPAPSAPATPAEPAPTAAEPAGGALAGNAVPPPPPTISRSPCRPRLFRLPLRQNRRRRR